MKIPLRTPILLYNYQYKQYPPYERHKAEIILVSKHNYWFGEGRVGYFEDGKAVITCNIMDYPHITHVVPYTMKNTNYGRYMQNPRNGHKQIDTEFFVGGMQWKDFEKENIE